MPQKSWGWLRLGHTLAAGETDQDFHFPMPLLARHVHGAGEILKVVTLAEAVVDLDSSLVDVPDCVPKGAQPGFRLRCSRPLDTGDLAKRGVLRKLGIAKMFRKPEIADDTQCADGLNGIRPALVVPGRFDDKVCPAASRHFRHRVDNGLPGCVDCGVGTEPAGNGKAFRVQVGHDDLPEAHLLRQLNEEQPGGARTNDRARVLGPPLPSGQNVRIA